MLGVRENLSIIKSYTTRTTRTHIPQEQLNILAFEEFI